MPAMYEVTFSDRDNEIVKWFNARGFYYRMGDGSELVVHPEPAWCCDCNKLMDAETIEPVDALRKSWELLCDRSSPKAQRVLTMMDDMGFPEDREEKEKRYQDNVTHAEKRMRWRESRKSDPKCLHCGSDDLRFPNQQEIVEVPGRGTARVHLTGMCSTDFLMWYYDPEGHRVE